MLVWHLLSLVWDRLGYGVFSVWAFWTQRKLDVRFCRLDFGGEISFGLVGEGRRKSSTRHSTLSDPLDELGLKFWDCLSGWFRGFGFGEVNLRV